MGVLTGCALILNGPDQVIMVRSEPLGATVQVSPENQTAVTPAAIKLKRKYPASLTVRKDKYQPQTVSLTRQDSLSIWRNLVWIHPLFWVVGIAADMGTGACYELAPAQIDVTLTHE